MLDGHLDDASTWTNFHPTAHPAEAARMHALVRDPARAQALIDFGLRPFGRMDLDPYHQPFGLSGPWVPSAADLTDEPLLVDVQTGRRFRVDDDGATLTLDLQRSDRFMGTAHLRALAAQRTSDFVFDSPALPAHAIGVEVPLPLTQPLQLHADDLPSLQACLDRLRALFCDTFHVRRLWLRGQRQDFTLRRDPGLTQALYGTARQSSLHPSLGRHATTNPDQMGHGFAFAGPNHAWKKPFLVWLMRANAHWFAKEPRCLDVLAEVLRDDDDDRFARLLLQIQMSAYAIGDPPHLAWPDEADDLRQWFFAFMKRREFGITLQQYGYVTSLLDVTDDLDVALYFSQAEMTAGRIQVRPPAAGRVIHVLAEPRDGRLTRHGRDLFWGSDGWQNSRPPRLARQHAGFVEGSTNRTQNLYADMIVATIHLGDRGPVTTLEDATLFPPPSDDLLFATLREARPPLTGLY